MSSKPLAGIRVLEMAAYIAGPYATSLLTSLGADVVKIEPPQGEAFRIGMDDQSAYFVQYNAGKKSVALDLKSPGGKAVVEAMLPHFDVLVENMRPGKMDQLGFGEAACRAINSALVYVSISGFGNAGEWRDRPSYDSIGQAMGGIYTFMNDQGDVRLTGTCIADLITGVNTALGIIAALFGRERGGKGTHLETSVFEAVSTLTIDAMTQARDKDIDPVRKTRHPQAQNFCLETASGDFIVLHLSSSQKFWRGLTMAIGRADMADNPRFATYSDRVEPENYFSIEAVLKQEFLKHPRVEWERRLVGADVPFAPALTMREIFAHPQAKQLELFGETPDHRTLIRPPWRFDGQRPERNQAAPRIGADTRAVLSELLGDGELGRLESAGVFPVASVQA
jgi:formyl-CoA transferase